MKVAPKHSIWIFQLLEALASNDLAITVNNISDNVGAMVVRNKVQAGLYLGCIMTTGGRVDLPVQNCDTSRIVEAL